jgi:hypothetical protein
MYPVKGVPEFWLTVMLKSDVTADLIKDKDLEILQFLSNVTVCGCEDVCVRAACVCVCVLVHVAVDLGMFVAVCACMRAGVHVRGKSVCFSYPPLANQNAHCLEDVLDKVLSIALFGRESLHSVSYERDLTIGRDHVYAYLHSVHNFRHGIHKLYRKIMVHTDCVR